MSQSRPSPTLFSILMAGDAEHKALSYIHPTIRPKGGAVSFHDAPYAIILACCSRCGGVGHPWHVAHNMGVLVEARFEVK